MSTKAKHKLKNNKKVNIFIKYKNTIISICLFLAFISSFIFTFLSYNAFKTELNSIDIKQNEKYIQKYEKASSQADEYLEIIEETNKNKKNDDYYYIKCYYNDEEFFTERKLKYSDANLNKNETIGLYYDEDIKAYYFVYILTINNINHKLKSPLLYETYDEIYENYFYYENNDPNNQVFLCEFAYKILDNGEINAVTIDYDKSIDKEINYYKSKILDDTFFEKLENKIYLFKILYIIFSVISGLMFIIMIILYFREKKHLNLK